MPTIAIPSALTKFTDGKSSAKVDGATVRAALGALDQRHPGIGGKLLAGDGVKPFIRIYVGAEDISALSGLDTPVGADDEISIIPAIAGGIA